MDNKDFDKIFSNKLEETQSFEFRESDWAEVSERLQQPKRKKRGGYWFWMLGAACLVLGLSTVYLAIDLNNTKQELATIQESLQKQQQADKSTTISKTNTPIENNINIANNQRPEKENTVQTESKKNQFITNSNTESKSKTLTKTYDNTTNNLTSIATDLKNNTSPNLTTQTNEKKKLETLNAATLIANEESVHRENIPSVELLALNVLSAFPLEELGEESIDFEPTPIIPKLKKYTKSKNRFGITTGVSLPEKLVDVSSSDGSLNRNAFDFGLHYSRDFFKKLNVWASVSYHTISYKDKKFNTLLSSNFLNAERFATLGNADPSAEITSKADARKNVLQYSLGVNYFLLQKNRWGLYAGLSAHAQTKLNNKIFVKDNQANSLSDSFLESYKEQSNKKTDAFRFHTIAAQLGYRFDLSKYLSCQLEASYQPKLAPNSTRIYEPLGLRTVVSYNF